MTKTVKHKAPWTLSQILSWVVPLLLVGVMWVLWFTDNFSFVGATVLSVMLGFLGMFFLITNSRLKRNSALTAVLEEDDKNTISVFQHKPRSYWTGKLDEGKNKAPLSRIKSINFGNAEGLPYAILSYNDSNNNSKALVIPFRILIQDDVRKYVAEGLKNTKKLSYGDDTVKERFRNLLAHGADLEVEVKSVDYTKQP